MSIRQFTSEHMNSHRVCLKMLIEGVTEGPDPAGNQSPRWIHRVHANPGTRKFGKNGYQCATIDMTL